MLNRPDRCSTIAPAEVVTAVMAAAAVAVLITENSQGSAVGDLLNAINAKLNSRDNFDAVELQIRSPTSSRVTPAQRATKSRKLEKLLSSFDPIGC